MTEQYNPNKRISCCPDDDAFDVSRIEVEFAIPVTVTQNQYGRMLDLIDEITDAPWNIPVEGVHWVAAQGSKPIWSKADSAFLGQVPDPNAPDAGEPSFDHSIAHISTSARGFLSEKERDKELRSRNKPRPPSFHNDVIGLAMRQAAKAFGGNDRQFNAAGFNTCFSRIAGVESTLDGQVVRAMLCGRRDVIIHEDGAHFQIVGSKGPYG